MGSGRFITLEGGEGVGKSTLQRAIAASIEAMGCQVVCTREPGGTPGAEAVRSLVLDAGATANWSAVSQLFLFNAARRDHLEKVILPALDAGVWVICDRFSDSTRAYQSAGGQVSSGMIEAMDRLSVGDHQPDLTLVLDLAPAAARIRRSERNGPEDVFERQAADFHLKIRAAFLDIAREHPERCVVLDASVSPSVLAEAAIAIIRERFSHG